MSHAVGGPLAQPVRSLAHSRPADGRRASHESISLIASARHRYVQGWGYDVIPPRSLAMGAVGIVDVCVPLLREKVVCAKEGLLAEVLLVHLRDDPALGDAAHGCEVISAPARARAVAASPGLDSAARRARRGRARSGRIPVALWILL